MDASVTLHNLDYRRSGAPRTASPMSVFFKDAWAEANGPDGGLTGCFNDESPPRPTCRFDYIFLWHDSGFGVQSAVVDQDATLSDHLPVIAGIE